MKGKNIKEAKALLAFLESRFPEKAQEVKARVQLDSLDARARIVPEDEPLYVYVQQNEGREKSNTR